MMPSRENVARAMFNRIYAWLWQLLPDRCECEGCCRQGMRGNENRIGGKIVCDYCHVALMAPALTRPQSKPLENTDDGA